LVGHELAGRRHVTGWQHQPGDRLAAWLGLAGRWRAFPGAADIYTDVVILMTDGLNTQNRWTTDQATIDAREAITCDNLRTAHVDVYTIQVNTGGDPTSTLLQNCASTSDKFYLLTSADQMTATFNKIGTNLTKLRVAQ
jgi:hypothetical protein